MDQVAIIEAVLVTMLPAGFLIVLFGGGALFLQKNIRQDGEPPLNRTLFYLSKYSILVLWGVMVVQSWGFNFSAIGIPGLLRLVALGLWGFGFLLMYLGRFRLGDSFRLGTPSEDTTLRTEGLFGVSRNPMYIGMYCTVTASCLYTLNPLVILMGMFVIGVHHMIVSAEEMYMQKKFGGEYLEYCTRVRRYI